MTRPTSQFQYLQVWVAVPSKLRLLVCVFPGAHMRKTPKIHVAMIWLNYSYLNIAINTSVKYCNNPRFSDIDLSKHPRRRPVINLPFEISESI